MNRHLLGKNLNVFHKIFITNHNDNLKNRYHFKLIVDYATFQLLSESTCFLKFSLLLNNFIS